ncbi:MAG: hypothetical protein WAN04_06445 [Candidatus Udaeobacter sp.]
MTQYQHTQIGHVIIWSVAVVLFAINATFGSSPHRGNLLVVSVVLLITLALFYKLTITIREETLCASFGIGVIRKRVSIAEIAACESIRIRWWYGWGIHLTPYGWLYNVSGLDAVAITLRNGGKFALGSDDPQGLAEAVRAAIE